MLGPIMWSKQTKESALFFTDGMNKVSDSICIDHWPTALNLAMTRFLTGISL